MGAKIAREGIENERTDAFVDIHEVELLKL